MEIKKWVNKTTFCSFSWLMETSKLAFSCLLSDWLEQWLDSLKNVNHIKPKQLIVLQHWKLSSNINYEYKCLNTQYQSLLSTVVKPESVMSLVNHEGYSEPINYAVGVKRGKTSASQSRLVLVLLLIGWDSVTCFLNYSLSVIVQN